MDKGITFDLHRLLCLRKRSATTDWPAHLGQSAMLVLLVLATLFGLTSLPVTNAENNPSIKSAMPIVEGRDFEFLRREESAAKALLGVKMPSRYLLLPESYGSPAATGVIKGWHVLGVTRKLLQFSTRSPDAVAAIVDHEVGHEWVRETKGNEPFYRHDLLAITCLSMAVLTCYWILGWSEGVAVLVFASSGATAAFFLMSWVRSNFSITSVAAMLGAAFAVVLLGFQGADERPLIRLRTRLLASVVVASTTLLSLLIFKPMLDRAKELEADRLAFQVLAASGRTGAVVPMMCWLESVTPTTGNPLLAVTLDHPTNDERLIRFGVTTGLRACGDVVSRIFSQASV